MFNNLKLAFQSFKKCWKDYLAISFVFAMIIFIGVLIGHAVLGLIISYIVIAIPAIISLKFCVYQAHNKQEMEYRSLKIGFLTFFKSIRVYFVVILKPLLVGLLFGLLVYFFFYERAINIASKSMPNIIESLTNYNTFQYAYNEMLKIENVKKIMTIGGMVSLIVGYLIYFALKLKRDYIPFIAFEMPINSKRAISLNDKMLKGKKYIEFFISNLVVLILLAIPGVLAYLVKIGLETNIIFSKETVTLLTVLTFILAASPIITIKQLNYAHSYKANSKPIEEEFSNELQNVIKEMEELNKKNNKNNE